MTALAPYYEQLALVFFMLAGTLYATFKLHNAWLVAAGLLYSVNVAGFLTTPFTWIVPLLATGAMLIGISQVTANLRKTMADARATREAR